MKKATNLKIYNRERDEMTDISSIFSIGSSTNPQWISLCGHLEIIFFHRREIQKHIGMLYTMTQQ